MNVSDIFKDAFKFPASNWKRFLILGIIVLVSTLLSVFGSHFGVSYIFLIMLPVYVLTFLYRGYLLRVIKVSINEGNELPAFNKWIQIFIDGLKVFLVNIIYLIIPVIVLMVGIFLTFDLSSGKFQFANLSPVVIIVLLIGVLLYALFMFFYEIGLANMAYHGKLEAALNLSEIREILGKIGWKKYLMVFVILLLITVVLYIIGYFSGSIPLIGVIVIGILISPYIELIVA